MLWLNTLVAATGLVAVSTAKTTPYRPGVPPSPFPSQAAAARLHINADTACQQSENATESRQVQLAAWAECAILGTYPYPRTDDPKNTDWLAGYKRVMHPDARFSFNNTRYNYDGMLEVYKEFSSIIGKNYGTGWQQWRDYYVSSPDTWDPKGKGGVVAAQGFNGGILKGQTVAANFPNAMTFVIKDIKGRRWITELKELGTAPTAWTLPKEGQKWPCDPVYEVCK